MNADFAVPIVVEDWDRVTDDPKRPAGPILVTGLMFPKGELELSQQDEPPHLQY